MGTVFYHLPLPLKWLEESFLRPYVVTLYIHIGVRVVDAKIGLGSMLVF